MAIFGCTQSIVRAFAYHQTKWYSIAGKGRLEKMGTLEGVSRIFEKYTFFGAFLEINIYRLVLEQKLDYNYDIVHFLFTLF